MRPAAAHAKPLQPAAAVQPQRYLTNDEAAAYL
ncbi:DNA-binding protein, partial [Pseudomonas aeruginosa]